MTFLFTDIEGSTRRWESDADGMRAALAAHDEVLRSAIETHGGLLFKHTGDGVCAAFSSPKAAMEAAVAAQLALELPVRMGLATGEAELRDGDYFGAVLNRAARVMAAGHGGQILLAESTAGLLSGVDLVDLGPRRLRDVPMPVGVFQVRTAGLRADFPPLRALDTSPGNLRLATSSFIGREADLDEVQAAVKAHRLVTLTGVGGVGKTRLALEVARRLTDEFPDGVWVFELAAVTDSAAVPDAVASVLGITQQPGKSMSESVAAAMEGTIRLLVIDNCEHVREDASDLVEAILARSATVKILATSREGLRVADEQAWLVPSLDVRAGTDSAAVALFVERARGEASRFSVAAPDEAAAVVEICRRLDGIPLAIELAASRMASMTAGEVRDRLDQRFRLLVGSRRALERHHTLRHAVAWSFELLDHTEKALLERCSVFSGGFDLKSACAVAGFDQADDLAVLDLLDALVRKSLLVADRSAGRTRYSMLETIRQFAEEQLVVRGEATEVRAAHSRYFAGRETDILALWDSPRQREAYDWFTTELANLRTAFRWAADQGDLDSATSLAFYATLFGLMVEQYEPVGWAEELIEPAGKVNHRRLAHLYVVAAQCHAAGRSHDAVGYLDASRQLTESGDFDKIPYELQSSTGIVYTHAGQSERWVELCRSAIERGAGPLTVTRACLVMAFYFLGNGDEAMAASPGMLAAADAANSPSTACFALLAHGLAHYDDDPSAAYDALRRSLTIAQESGNRQMESASASTVLLVAATYREPIECFETLLVLIGRYYDVGNTALLRNPLAILASLLEGLGHHEQAAIISGFASTDFSRASYPQLNAAIAHLRDVLGDQTYESLARQGETMTPADMVAYAYDQIDQALAELNAASEYTTRQNDGHR
ncbi:ATP-binding protein [Mycobacterium mantenii]|uniref:Cyclase n=1 Tax=Mycobacterium mantenii TaxID=560555 RepID=A0A1A2TLG0_MYCNT|nr:adenylate/guanylate cyclase domain-containing protein [Mycobacterium mantenii]OBH40492.1 cyclase [Mycobacterium mantenii]OBH76862.1 cyclase [Mycobacterium mantenii]